jgi:hypothetical protein
MADENQAYKDLAAGRMTYQEYREAREQAERERATNVRENLLHISGAAQGSLTNVVLDCRWLARTPHFSAEELRVELNRIADRAEAARDAMDRRFDHRYEPYKP